MRFEDFHNTVVNTVLKSNIPMKTNLRMGIEFSSFDYVFIFVIIALSFAIGYITLKWVNDMIYSHDAVTMIGFK